MSIAVVEPGLLTTVQDVAGRRSWRHLGVPSGGAADRYSARLANRLVGNPDEDPLLEATVAGPTLRFDVATAVAVAGADLGARLDGVALAPGAARFAPSGSTLRFGARNSGARAYLAVAGGLDVERILGSASTDLRGGFGGVEGRALRAGDRLALRAPRAARILRVASTRAGDTVSAADELRTPIRVLPGPHRQRLGREALETLCGVRWTVGDKADRAAVRLDGADLWQGRAAAEAEVPSVGLAEGALQIPPDGRPIVMLADRPVTGGYAVPAVVIRADLGRVAQLVPGDEVRFAEIDVAGALVALREREEGLAVEAAPPDGADAAAWAGSLD